MDDSKTEISGTGGYPTTGGVKKTGGYNFYDPKKDAGTGRNTYARNALIAGCIAVVILLLPVPAYLNFLAPIAGVAWGIAGIVRASSSGIGRSTAVWGLCLSGLALLIAVITVVAVTAAANTAQFDKAGVQQQILDGVQKQSGLRLASVQCPETPSMKEGNEFQCVATAEDATTTMVNIRVQDSKGNITWAVQ